MEKSYASSYPARANFQEKALSLAGGEPPGRRRAPRLGDLPRHTAVDVEGEGRCKDTRASGDSDNRLSVLLRAHQARSADGGGSGSTSAGGSPRSARRPLRTSRRVSMARQHDYVQLNQYRLLDEPIGQGSYGIVKLAYNEEDDTHYAMKILSKRKLLRRACVFGRTPPPRRAASSGPSVVPAAAANTPDPLHRIYREIAVLKKLDHPNIVKLVEVLDDPDEDMLYLVFQLLEGGPVLEVPTSDPLPEEVARGYFRDALLGIEYLHYQRIAHRDIKPANLLLGENGRLQVADLGVAGELAAGDAVSGAAGTPAFRAPEAQHDALHIDGKAADIWSLGVTLYCLCVGDVPWGGSVSEVSTRIRSAPLSFPAPPAPAISAPLRDLLQRMMAKDPADRATMKEIKEHPWVTCSGNEPLPSEDENCCLVEVTEEDMARVVTSIPNLSTLILIKTMLKNHSFQNPFLRGRENSSASTSSREGGAEVGTWEGEGAGAAVGIARRKPAPTLSRSGRSISAPGSYLTDRQASFDSNLPALNESQTDADIQETNTVMANQQIVAEINLKANTGDVSSVIEDFKASGKSKPMDNADSSKSVEKISESKNARTESFKDGDSSTTTVEKNTVTSVKADGLPVDTLKTEQSGR